MIMMVMMIMKVMMVVMVNYINHKISRFRIEDFIDEEIVNRDEGTAEDERWSVTRIPLLGKN